MAGAVGIVFGLCVLSFTAGAALMYVVVRRREDPEVEEVPQAVPQPEAVAEPPGEQLELRWHDPEYEVKPIHRNPVVGMPPVLEETEEPQPETVLSDPEPEPEVEQRRPEAVLPAQAEPSVHENASPPERDEFRQRYLQTFEAARRRAAGSNN